MMCHIYSIRYMYYIHRIGNCLYNTQIFLANRYAANKRSVCKFLSLPDIRRIKGLGLNIKPTVWLTISSLIEYMMIEICFYHHIFYFPTSVGKVSDFARNISDFCIAVYGADQNR